jgi:hypothetical protein
MVAGAGSRRLRAATTPRQHASAIVTAHASAGSVRAVTCRLSYPCTDQRVRARRDVRSDESESPAVEKRIPRRAAAGTAATASHSMTPPLLRAYRPASRLPRGPSIARWHQVREPIMVAESHPRWLGIGQRHTAPRRIGWAGRLPRAIPPVALRVRVCSIRRRAATTEKHRQERHQQDDHEVQHSSRIYSAQLRPTRHQTEVSARSRRGPGGWILSPWATSADRAEIPPSSDWRGRVHSS